MALQMEHVRYQKVLNLMYELAEEGTDMPKHAVVLKDHTLKCSRNLCTDLVYQLMADS